MARLTRSVLSTSTTTEGWLRQIGVVNFAYLYLLVIGPTVSIQIYFTDLLSRFICNKYLDLNRYTEKYSPKYI